MTKKSTQNTLDQFLDGSASRGYSNEAMENVTQILNAIQDGDRTAAGQLPPLGYDELAKSPKDRFADAESLRKALLACECAAEWDAEKAARWWAARPEEAAPTEVAPAPGPGATDPKSPTVITIRVRY